MTDEEWADDLAEQEQLEGEAVEAIEHLAILLAGQARHIWNWGDGEGGYVRNMLEEAFDQAGLRRRPPSSSPRGGRNRHKIAPNIRAQVYARDGLKCVRCGSTDDLTVDHILAHVHGGADSIENLQTLCRICNSSKGAR